MPYVKFAIDTLKAKGIDPKGVHAKTLAALVKVTRQKMSFALQTYRREQQHGRTDYVIAGYGYGRDARWRILYRPGSDPKVVQRARAARPSFAASPGVTSGQDVVCELEPGLGGSALGAAIASVLPFVTAQHDAIGRSSRSSWRGERFHPKVRSR